MRWAGAAGYTAQHRRELLDDLRARQATRAQQDPERAQQRRRAQDAYDENTGPAVRRARAIADRAAQAQDIARERGEAVS